MGEKTGLRTSVDLILGDLDCNDNTPVLKPRSNPQHHNDQANSGDAVKNNCQSRSLPARAAGRNSTTSDIQGGAGGGPQSTYSPDDTLNNDFFYDDEFAVPFDCNLAEMGTDSLLDSVELNRLLFSGQDSSKPCSDDNHGWRNPRMATSKSDTCLYQVEYSEDSEKEMSTSDKDCCTSSEMSDFRSEPLFASTVGTETDDELTVSVQATDSLTGEISGSYNQDRARFVYDWRANKDQYILSFDRSPSRISADSFKDSFQDGPTSEPRSLTSWALKSEGSSWGSRSSKKDSSSQSDTLTPGATSNKSSTPDTLNASNKTFSPFSQSPMSTWRHLRDSSEISLTTWRDHARSQSLPDIKTQDIPEVEQVSLSADNQPKMFSGPLMEAFQRERSLSGGKEHEQASNEAMVSPHSLQQLMGTWSMSPINMSAVQDSVDESTEDDGMVNLISWNTVKDLSTLSRSNDSCQQQLEGNKFLANLSLLVHKDASSQIDPQTSMTGSVVVTPTPRPTKRYKDLGVQFPPSLRDCSIQTSLEESVLQGLPQKMQSKSMQTSLSSSRCSSYKDLLLQQPIKCKIKQSSNQSKCPMVRSAITIKSDLPDLSFLKRDFSKSNQSSSLKPRRPMSGIDAYVPNSVPKPRRSFSSDAASNWGSGEAKRRNSCDVEALRGQITSCKTRIPNSSMNSVCSSTSSGIDPGSSESQCSACRSASCADAYRLSCPHHSVSNSSSEEDFRLAIQAGQACRGIRLPRKACQPKTSSPLRKPNKGVPNCHSCNSDKASSMATSHPTYRHLGHLSQGSCKDVEYLMVSPVHAGQQACRHWSHPDADRLYCESSQNQSSDEIYLGVTRRPLKSCLAKRRNQRRSVVFKHRSWSDPSDGRVLKHSQDGQIIYQLVTAGCDECSYLRDKSEGPPAMTDMAEKSARLRPTSLDERDDSSTTISTGSIPLCSPDQIPLPSCTCGTTHAVLHGSPVSPLTPQPAMPPCRTKKSVSFSEEISYHSPGTSPRCPRKLTDLMLDSEDCHETACMRKHKRCAAFKKRPLSFPGALNSQQVEWDMDPPSDEAPSDFQVSPSPSPPPHSSICPPDPETAKKKELVFSVMRGVDLITEYFSAASNQQTLVALSSTNLQTETGRLVLQHVCSPITNLVSDGLNNHIPSIFGKVQNSLWTLVLESAQPGRSPRVLQELVSDLKGLHILDNVNLKFNAFVFALLNHKALDYWLTYIQHSENLLMRHYSSEAILRKAATASPWRQLLLELSTKLQPLGQIPWSLEYDFEVRIAREKQQKMLAQYLLEKHTMKMSQSQESLTSESGVKPRLNWPPPPSQQSASETSRRATGSVTAMMGSGQSVGSSTSSGPPGVFYNSYQSDVSSTCSGPPTIFSASPASSHDGSTFSTPRVSPVPDMFSDSQCSSSCASYSSPARYVPAEKRDVKDLTQYQFKSSPAKLPRALPPRCNSEELPSKANRVFTKEGTPVSVIIPAVDFEMPGKRATPRSDSLPMRLGALADSSTCPSPDSQQSSLVVRGRSALKKGWSTFGPKLISVFDKLLLSETKTSRAGEGSSVLASQEGSQKVVRGENQQLTRTVSVDTGVKQPDVVTSTESSHSARYVQTLCHYVAREAEQLSFDKSVVLTVVSEVDSDWLLCCFDDKEEGLVHRACVKSMEGMPSCTSL